MAESRASKQKALQGRCARAGVSVSEGRLRLPKNNLVLVFRLHKASVFRSPHGRRLQLLKVGGVDGQGGVQSVKTSFLCLLRTICNWVQSRCLTVLQHSRLSRFVYTQPSMTEGQPLLVWAALRPQDDWPTWHSPLGINARRPSTVRRQPFSLDGSPEELQLGTLLYHDGETTVCSPWIKTASLMTSESWRRVMPTRSVIVSGLILQHWTGTTCYEHISRITLSEYQPHNESNLASWEGCPTVIPPFCIA